MSNLTIGPIFFGGERLALMIGAASFLLCASILAFRVEKRLLSWALDSILIGILAARLLYVGIHWDVFRAHPMRAFAVWQGGFKPVAAIVTTVLFGFWHFRETKARIAGMGALCAGVIAWNVGHQLVATVDRIAPPTNRIATLGGKPVSLASLTGKPLIVNLWASWCPPCRRELPMMAKKAAGQSAVSFVFANQGEGNSSIRHFLEKQNIHLKTVLVDKSFSLSRYYNVRGYPMTLYLAADGVLKDMHVGELSEAGLDDAIAELAGNR